MDEGEIVPERERPRPASSSFRRPPPSRYDPSPRQPYRNRTNVTSAQPPPSRTSRYDRWPRETRPGIESTSLSSRGGGDSDAVAAQQRSSARERERPREREGPRERKRSRERAQAPLAARDRSWDKRGALSPSASKSNVSAGAMSHLAVLPHLLALPPLVLPLA